jgi:hypothetical protein
MLMLLFLACRADNSIVIIAVTSRHIVTSSDPTPIAATIATADGLLDGCMLPCNVKPSSPLGMQMTAAAAILDQYNNGLLTPDCTP